jgi:hypothetical protein
VKNYAMLGVTMASISNTRERTSAIRFMLRPTVIIAALILALAFLLVGCSSEVPAEPTPTQEQEVSEPTPTEVVEENSPAVEQEVEVAVDQACVDCHQDKERLIDTADPEEPVEAESSGEG